MSGALRRISLASVAIAFGLDPSWGMLTVPLIAWLAGFGWACFGIMVAGFAKSFENFNYIVSAVLTPLFLVAGTFFPLSGLPKWAQVLGEVNPLHHCVQLVPSQTSASVVVQQNFWPLRYSPTARHPNGQDTLVRYEPPFTGVGGFCSVQLVPSHRSASRLLSPLPTAVHAEVPVHDTASRASRTSPGTWGVG